MEEKLNMNTENKSNPCLLCGEQKISQKHLVCPKCYGQWKIEAARALASDEGTIILQEPWLLERMKKVLQEMDQEKARCETLRTETENEAIAHITSKTAGQKIDPEVLKLALTERRRILWDKKGGKKLSADIQANESRYALLKSTCTVIEASLIKPPVSTSAVPAEATPEPSSATQIETVTATTTTAESAEEEASSLPLADSQPARTLTKKDGDNHPQHEEEERHTVGSRGPKGGRGGNRANLALMVRRGIPDLTVEEQ